MTNCDATERPTLDKTAPFDCMAAIPPFIAFPNAVAIIVELADILAAIDENDDVIDADAVMSVVGIWFNIFMKFDIPLPSAVKPFNVLDNVWIEVAEVAMVVISVPLIEA